MQGDAIEVPGLGANYRSLHDFEYFVGGYRPEAGLTLMDGALYGTTCLRKSYESGSVYRMDLQGHVNTIHSFTGPDGACPIADLLKLDGKFYGTTSYGGSACQLGGGCGTVFELSKTASGWSERVLYSFKGGNDGERPEAGLAYMNGVFYGTTFTGGSGATGCLQSGCGTVYSVTPSGEERVIHRYHFSDGAMPLSRFIIHNGVLYGTASHGGKYGTGTVFAMNSAGNQRILLTLDGYDGWYPPAGVTYYKGYLYGTTASQDESLSGAVYKVSLSGKVHAVLHVFNLPSEPNDGQYPSTALSMMGNTFYGATLNGGAFGTGTVFSITPTGQERVIYSFHNSHGAGWRPVTKLTPVNGTLYGATEEGGHKCPGCGTVFEITP